EVVSGFGVPVAVTPARDGVPARIHVLGDLVPGEAAWVSGAQGVVSAPEPSADDTVWVGADEYPERVYWNAPVEVTHPAQYPNLYTDHRWSPRLRDYEEALGRAVKAVGMSFDRFAALRRDLRNLLLTHRDAVEAATGLSPEQVPDFLGLMDRSIWETPASQWVRYSVLRAAIGDDREELYGLAALLRDRPELNTTEIVLDGPDQWWLNDAHGRGLSRGGEVEGLYRLFLVAKFFGHSAEELLELRAEMLATAVDSRTRLTSFGILQAAHAAGVRAETDPDPAVVDGAGLADWVHAELMPLLDLSGLPDSLRADLERPHHRLHRELRRTTLFAAEDRQFEELVAALDDPTSPQLAHAYTQAAPPMRRAYADFLAEHGAPGMLTAHVDADLHWLLTRAVSDAELLDERLLSGGGSFDKVLFGRVEQRLATFALRRTLLEDTDVAVTAGLSFAVLRQWAADLIKEGRLQAKLRGLAAMTRSGLATLPAMPPHRPVWLVLPENELPGGVSLEQLLAGRSVWFPAFQRWTVSADRADEQARRLTQEREARADAPRVLALRLFGSPARDLTLFDPTAGVALTGEDTVARAALAETAPAHSDAPYTIVDLHAIRRPSQSSGPLSPGAGVENVSEAERTEPRAATPTARPAPVAASTAVDRFWDDFAVTHRDEWERHVMRYEAGPVVTLMFSADVSRAAVRIAVTAYRHSADDPTVQTRAKQILSALEKRGTHDDWSADKWVGELEARAEDPALGEQALHELAGEYARQLFLAVTSRVAPASGTTTPAASKTVQTLGGVRTLGRDAADLVHRMTRTYLESMPSESVDLGSFLQVAVAWGLKGGMAQPVDVVSGMLPLWERTTGSYDLRHALLSGPGGFYRALDALLWPSERQAAEDSWDVLQLPQYGPLRFFLPDADNAGVRTLGHEHRMALGILHKLGGSKEVPRQLRATVIEALREVAARTDERPDRLFWLDSVQQDKVPSKGQSFTVEELTSASPDLEPDFFLMAEEKQAEDHPDGDRTLVLFEDVAPAIPMVWSEVTARAEPTTMHVADVRWVEGSEQSAGVSYWHVKLAPEEGTTPSAGEMDAPGGDGGVQGTVPSRDGGVDESAASDRAALVAPRLSREVSERWFGAGEFREGRAGASGRFWAGQYSARGWAVREPLLERLDSVDTLFQPVGQGAQGYRLAFGEGVLFFSGHGVFGRGVRRAGGVSPEQVARYADWWLSQPGAPELTDVVALPCGDGSEVPSEAYAGLSRRGVRVWDFSGAGALSWADDARRGAGLFALPDEAGRASYMRVYVGGRQVSRVPAESGAAGLGWRSDVPYPPQELVNRARGAGERDHTSRFLVRNLATGWDQDAVQRVLDQEVEPEVRLGEPVQPPNLDTAQDFETVGSVTDDDDVAARLYEEAPLLGRRAQEEAGTPGLLLSLEESDSLRFGEIYGRLEWRRRADLFELLLGSASAQDEEARAAEQRALEALPRLLTERGHDGPVTDLFGGRGRPERGAFVEAVLEHIRSLQQVASGLPPVPALSEDSMWVLSEQGHHIRVGDKDLLPFFGVVFAVHGRLGLPEEDRLPFMRAVAAGVLGSDRWNTSLLTVVRAAASAGYVLPGLGDPLGLEAAVFYDRVVGVLAPAGLPAVWEGALVPPHRQVVDPVPGYFSVGRVDHLDE
ncbi:hypothetical protein, partial [Streptomyces albus]|uniref:hypothetical protein n=1 Tax=Streptomyces albus TaxID=1888 RepID=UPI0033C59FE6